MCTFYCTVRIYVLILNIINCNLLSDEKRLKRSCSNGFGRFLYGLLSVNYHN